MNFKTSFHMLNNIIHVLYTMLNPEETYFSLFTLIDIV